VEEDMKDTGFVEGQNIFCMNFHIIDIHLKNCNQKIHLDNQKDINFGKENEKSRIWCIDFD
jgi:hypothetical protein